MKSLGCFVALVIASTAVSPAAAGAGRVQLKKGDRIVFLGDSITQGGVGPKGYVTLIKNALAEKQKEYVEASRAVGDSSLAIALRQILPNIISPLIVNATVRLGYVILIVAALSFLGLGTPPPTPDWGSDLAAARDYMETAPLIAAFPGLAICYTVLAFNLFGDGLRDILDPRLAER